MSDVIIKANERSKIRVFAVNLPPGEVADTLKTQPKPDVARQLLNSPHLNTSSTEIFPVSDLTGVGLSGYLGEGYAVGDEQLAADRGKLDGLDGYVLLLFSDSFAGAETTLTPSPELTLIGTYTEARPSDDVTPITADSAKPYSGVAASDPPVPPRGPAGSAMVILGLIGLVALAVWWLLA
ncbi:hypothetical protein KX928_22395 [Roseobacter sp. YSTF-M11]|uniref:Uncharacterized protein n=1 Tax=Roseobacter insulae TaxID=2859783 RepID=A0A9X1K593_9RHOB|nr:hypothetical protein [Roseobacter insulae]MBW4710547.1 hypothetical protein [Roseobacter insulae]